MKFKAFSAAARTSSAVAAIVLVASLAACSSSKKPQPAELPPVVAVVGVRPAWNAQLGQVNFPLDASVNGSTVTVAGGNDGTVVAIDAQTGRDIWRTALGTPLSAGVGSDGKTAAVVTKANEVVALEAGREVWRQKMPAQIYTAPFVAGGRVFVLSADRSVSALDGQTGRKLWTQQRPGTEPLILRQPGVLLAVGDTLLVASSGRLLGLNPANGSVRWEAPIATPRGTNDVERLVDLVGRVSRQGNVVCTRAFQMAVGCVNASRGTLLWTKPAVGFEGVHGDDTLVFGTESDGKVVAWKRADGERVWSTDRLQYRTLTAPLALGRSVVMGDSTGLVHLLSREDGSVLNRLTTDGSAIVAAPVAAGDTLVVVTQKGGIFGFRPE